MIETLSRRKFLVFGAAASTLAITPRAVAAVCGELTPPQAKGPFYPGETNFTLENDLTQVPGHTQKAKGQVIYIKGKVLDQNCQPVAKANVEIWQACVSGKYNHANDPNPAAVDPHFKYWGETFTNESGEYIFKTIVPGAYPADTDWIRPPHIHFKISKIGFRELVTQMYFEGDELNEKDLILQSLSQGERESVVVKFSPAANTRDPGSLEGNFDITIRSIR